MAITKEQELISQIVKKAWEDESFKNELIANPTAAIEKLTGKTVNISEGKTIVVRDQSSDSAIYINIPAQQEVDAELTEDQLESVAGGVIFPGILPILLPTPTFPTIDVILF